MNEAAVAVIALVAGFFLGSVVGLNAEESYVRKHCDRTGQMLIEKEHYTCARTKGSPP